MLLRRGRRDSEVTQKGFLGEATLLLGSRDSSGSPQGEQLGPLLLGHPELALIQPLTKQMTEKPKPCLFVFNNLLKFA